MRASGIDREFGDLEKLGTNSIDYNRLLGTYSIDYNRLLGTYSRDYSF